MNQAEIHQFLVNFFKKRQATFEHNEPGLLKIKLTEDLDQRLMNRPFYWQYVKKLGYKGDPMSVTFISDKQKKGEAGEWIHYGSPRLEQLFQMILDEGKYAELYEQINQDERHAFHPWFICNMLVRYRGAYTHDEMVSVGVYLINGAMRFRMMDEIINHQFNEVIPDYCYKIPPIINRIRAIQIINRELQHRISERSTNFEYESFELYQKEKNMTEELFQGREDDIDLLKENIEQQIYDRLYPKVDLSLINCGLFYLTESRSKKLLNVS
ncbi:YqhG family protein [Tenuibacillus multivorans]|uniref:Uncharacterized protein n=1 Tax=Tenuibacillus multivorans TaxID=237069 RepID=A0A1G9Z8G0_9BACI|nr:YqhG family protein [Tenuibacillus multivorans]GEL77347.1 hypothetical protein TMU01_15820 [Tenuibacillus multivorans]SDN17838.1 protein YqhG of unknown function [Tenuibacillus multivorans]